MPNNIIIIKEQFLMMKKKSFESYYKIIIYMNLYNYYLLYSHNFMII